MIYSPPVAEKRSPKPKAGKRVNGKPEPAGVKTRSKAATPKPKPKAASTKNSRGAKTAPGDVKAARKRVPSRASVPPREPPPPPAPAAVIARRRGLPKPRLAETTGSAVLSPDAQTGPVARRPNRRRVRPATAGPSAAPVPDPGLDTSAADLTEEERIESSKYDVRERPRRVFEEERFLFPETYEADRVRLLVKDPEWLFAHWDVSPVSLQRLRDDVGERAMALSRLTLKVEDPADSPLSVVLLPEGARSWYVRTHLAHRAYRAQLGLTMPSGEFRPLAMSNIVVAPRSGPSQQRARRRVAFSRRHAAQAAAELLSGAAPASQAANASALREGSTAVDYIDAADEPARPEPSPGDQGGASGELGPGGASDTFRR